MTDRNGEPLQLGELETLLKTMEGAVQLTELGPDAKVAIDAECELWKRRAGMEPGGMAADPKKSIAGLQRIMRAPEASPRAAAVASIMLALLRRHLDEEGQ